VGEYSLLSPHPVLRSLPITKQQERKIYFPFFILFYFLSIQTTETRFIIHPFSLLSIHFISSCFYPKSWIQVCPVSPKIMWCDWSDFYS
jgi:hypothetical protein